MKTKVAVVLIPVIPGMALTSPGVAFSQEVVIIVNKKNATVSSLTSDDIQGIFLAKKTQWNNGAKIDFVTLKDCPTHDEFLKKYLQKTSSQFQRYFRTLVFTGKGSFPKSFDTEEGLVGYAAGAEGAVGYVSSGTNTSSVKVISEN